MTFHEAWPDRIEAYFDDVLVPIIGQAGEWPPQGSRRHRGARR